MRYRDLVRGEMIQAGDEFLTSFTGMWKSVPDSTLSSEFSPAIYLQHRRPIVEQWSVSTNEENYQGQFDSLEEAIGEIEGYGDGTYWIGRCVEPRPAEQLFSVDLWLEEVMEDEDYASDWSEGFFEKMKDRKKDLEQHIRTAIGEWFEQNKMRPHFWNIDSASVQRYVVEDGKAVLT